MPRALYRARLAASESASNEKAVYGEMLPMVSFIRARGWVVFREGGMYRVGTKLLTAEGVADVYRREKERHERGSSERLVATGSDGEGEAGTGRDDALPGRQAGGRRRKGGEETPTRSGASPHHGVEEGAS